MHFSLNNLRRDDRGITGLETAIILIAFVVVASVFAFTILNSGVFASERSKQAVFAGLRDTRSSLVPKGGARAYRGFDATNSGAVFKVSFTVANGVDGEPIDLTPPYTADASGIDPDPNPTGTEYVTVMSYWDNDQYMPDMPWTVDWVGFSSGDNLLEVGETAEITVWLMDRDTAVAIGSTSSILLMDGGATGGTGGISAGDTPLIKNRNFRIEVKPPRGAIVSVERKTPAALKTVMDLR